MCVVFLEADNTNFSPACIKSHFLHTFILVRVSPRIKRKITRYEVSVVTRDEVGAYKPYLWEQSVFEKGNFSARISLYALLRRLDPSFDALWHNGGREREREGLNNQRFA